MLKLMFSALSKAWQTYVALGLYGVVVIWWLFINYIGDVSDTQTYYFNFGYGFLALLGVMTAVMASRRVWGGWRSTMGKMLMLIAGGLFLEWLGICVWLYYNLSGTSAPYPSLADFGYFGLIPFYIAGSLMLAKATGVKFHLDKRKGKLVATLLPLLALLIAIVLFVRNVGFDMSHPLQLFFNVAYPVGEIIPVTIVTIALTLSTRMLKGGIMHGRVVLLAAAFFAQFCAEYLFLYQFGADTYVNAGLADLAYASSYLVMCLAVISFSRVD